MNRFRSVPLVLLFTAAVAGAQTKEVIEEVDANLTQLRIAIRHTDERNEDVEILRRLLNKSLGLDGMVSVLLEPPTSYIGSTTVPLNSTVGGGTFKVSDMTRGIAAFPPGKRVTQPVGPFDGVYLKGAGVVYTLRIPAGADFTFDPTSQAFGLNSTCAVCHAGTNSGDGYPHAKSGTSASVSLSDWDRTRMELRGEKPAAPEPRKAGKPRGVLCEPGTLTEQLIGQLYAHAKNVRHLGEKESVTLVVTFDSLPGAMQAAGEPATKLGLTADEVQKLTLGDLHAKQGKHAEAVEAYLMGLVRFREPVVLSFPPNIPHTDALAAIQDMSASLSNTYKSLAAAYLQLGQVDDAKAALEKATSLLVSLSTTKASDNPKPVGPAKLILSVSKADIAAKDAAVFKKAVTVERMNFPVVEGKKTK